MQINSNSVFYPPVTLEQSNKSNRLPVVIEQRGDQSFQNAVKPYRVTDVADSNASANRDHQQAQFVHASARTASSDNTPAGTKLPKPVQHYLQIASISDAHNTQSSGFIDEKV